MIGDATFDIDTWEMCRGGHLRCHWSHDRELWPPNPLLWLSHATLLTPLKNTGIMILMPVFLPFIP